MQSRYGITVTVVESRNIMKDSRLEPGLVLPLLLDRFLSFVGEQRIQMLPLLAESFLMGGGLRGV